MTTLAQLKTDMDAWLIRDDLAVDASFASMLRIAEANINRDTRTVAQEAHTTLNLTSASIAVPSLFREVRYMHLESSSSPSAGVLEYKSPEQLRTTNEGKRTSYYTIEGDGSNGEQFTFSNPGNASTPPQIGLGYYTSWAALVADIDTNILLQTHYDVYLYALLRAAAEYLQEDAIEDRYQGKYDRVITLLATDESRKRQRMGNMKSYGNPRGVV